MCTQTSVQLERCSEAPILAPVPDDPWQCREVYGAGAAIHDGRVHLLYTASGDELKEPGGYMHRTKIGLATSDDGLRFTAQPDPFMDAAGEEQWLIDPWGVEDARITPMGDAYYIAYVPASPEWQRIALAVTRDFQTVEKHGLLMGDMLQSCGGLFPEKVDGRFLLMHRLRPNIWVSASDDLRTFDTPRLTLTTHDVPWGALRVGMGPPPIPVANGWALIFHGQALDGIYRLGIAWLDRSDPSRVIHVQQEPILVPETAWEMADTPMRKGVYACGAITLGDTLYVYYGAAQRTLHVAACPRESIEI